MEKEDYIWRRKTYFFRREQNRERKMRNKFGNAKGGKRGKCLEKKNMFFFAEENNNGEGKGGSFARGQSIQMIICKGPVYPDDHL